MEDAKGTVTLGAGSLDMGLEREDIENWFSFVEARLSKKLWFPVVVSNYGETSRQTSTRIECDTPKQEDAVRDALRDLYDDWCHEGMPAR